MKKQNAQMIILLTILLLCVCGYFLVKMMPKEDEEVISDSYTVTNVVQEDVVGMSYLHEGKIVELIKENNIWKVKENCSLNLDQTVIEGMLGDICSITTDTVIEEPETLAEYGLSNPSNTVCLTLSDQSIIQVLIGDYVDLTAEYYALLAGDSKVYTIPSYVAVTFEKSVEELLVKEEENNSETSKETTEENAEETIEEITEESLEETTEEIIEE